MTASPEQMRRKTVSSLETVFLIDCLELGEIYLRRRPPETIEIQYSSCMTAVNSAAT